MELITTLATVPAIIALVTLAKDLGLPSKLSPLLAVVLGVALALVDAYVTGGLLDGPGIVSVVAAGVILGLSAAGLYDGAKAVGARRDPVEHVLTDGVYVPKHAKPHSFTEHPVDTKEGATMTDEKYADIPDTPEVDALEEAELEEDEWEEEENR